MLTAEIPSKTRLWTGVLAAPLAWGVAQWVGFVTASNLCARQPDLVASTHTETARIVNLVICGICLLVALIGLIVAANNVRFLLRSSGGSVSFGRATFMAIGGLFSSVVFVGAIVLFAVPALIVNVCNHAR